MEMEVWKVPVGDMFAWHGDIYKIISHDDENDRAKVVRFNPTTRKWNDFEENFNQLCKVVLVDFLHTIGDYNAQTN